MKKNILLISTLVLIFCNGQIFAQTQPVDDIEVINLESIYQSAKPNVKPNSKVTKSVEVKSESKPVVATSSDPLPLDVPPAIEYSDSNVGELKDLNRLSPFREVSVIQKKYLPKTERFQFYGALAATTNTPWFLSYGAKLNLAYHFSEAFSLEFSGLFLSTLEREVAKEIRDNNGLRPEQFIYTKGYYGLDLVVAPIYGKLSNLDGSIIPFDMYFSLGAGVSNTNSVEGSVPTIHIGTGQIFAITKSIAFRWDYSLNAFQATAVSVGSLATPAKGSYNDLILTAGVSFFFPEASLR